MAVRGGRLEPLIVDARRVVAALTGEAAKDWKDGRSYAVSELPERRTKDRDSIPEDGANGIG